MPSCDSQFWNLDDGGILDDRVARSSPIPQSTAERQSTAPVRLIAAQFQGSIAAELEALDCELFTDLVQAGHTEILAFQQVVSGATDQFADG